MDNCCKCVLAGRKFLNEDGSTNIRNLAILLERWEREQLALNIERQIAFTVINGYVKNLCQCECHVIIPKKGEEE